MFKSEINIFFTGLLIGLAIMGTTVILVAMLWPTPKVEIARCQACSDDIHHESTQSSHIQTIYYKLDKIEHEELGSINSQFQGLENQIIDLQERVNKIEQPIKSENNSN